MWIYLIVAAVLLIIAGILIIYIKKKQKEVLIQENLSDTSQEKRCLDSSAFMMTQIKGVAEEEYSCFDHVYIPTVNKTPRLIDAIAIGVRGIFVFHFIPVEGWILGNGNSRWWTHFVSTDDRHYMNNPIWEFDKVIDDLKVFLPKTRTSDYRPYIVFSNKCELRSVETDGDTRVINQRQLWALLENDMMTAPVVYDDEMVNKMSKVFEVLDDPFRLEERLQALMAEMDETRLDKIRETTLENEKAEIEASMLHTLSPEERQKLREERHIRKYRPEERFTRSELMLRDALILWRKQQADIKGVSTIEIFDNRILDALIALKPKTIESLRQISWFDDKNISLYGNAIVNMVKHAPES